MPNIIDVYYTRKENNIINYTRILMKNAFNRKYMNIKYFEKIIQNYIKSDFSGNINTSYRVNKFLKDNEIKNLKLRKVINYTINFLDNDEVANDLDENKDYIILISKLILFSVQINEKMNVVTNPGIKYTTIISKVLMQYSNIYNEEIKEIISSSEKELNEKIKEDITDDRNFFKYFKNNKFYIDFLKLKTDIYNVNFHYKIKQLKKFAADEVKNQIESKNRLNVNCWGRSLAQCQLLG